MDIAERLQVQALRDGPSELHKEAADTIEVLRREAAFWRLEAEALNNALDTLLRIVADYRHHDRMGMKEKVKRQEGDLND
jgi:hypothetical protein